LNWKIENLIDTDIRFIKTIEVTFLTI